MSKDSASPWVPMLLSTGITLTAFAGITYWVVGKFPAEKQDLAHSHNGDQAHHDTDKGHDNHDTDKGHDNHDTDKGHDNHDTDKGHDNHDTDKETGTDETNGTETHWSYKGTTGPEHWAELEANYALADSGKRQSPIDLIAKSAITPTNLDPVEFNYQDSVFKLKNNGHTIRADCDLEKNSIQIGGHQYSLLQFHFHATSEHLINGENYPMEVHLVHVINKKQEEESDSEAEKKPESYAVVGVMIKEGEENPLIRDLWSKIPGAEEGSINYFIKGENVSAFLPPEGKRSYYRYNGSLTTPPCSENVLWSVMTEPIEFSKEQIEIFTNLYKENNRPVQELHRRFVLHYQDSTKKPLVSEPVTTPGGQSQPAAPGKPDPAIPPLHKGEVGILPTPIIINPTPSQPAQIPPLSPQQIKPTLTIND